MKTNLLKIIVMALLTVFITACGGSGGNDDGVDTPKTEAPKTEAPKTEAPKVEAPKTEAPKTTPAVVDKNTILPF